MQPLAWNSCLGLAHQMELNWMQLKARTYCRDEILPELVKDVECLVCLAYPEAAEAMVEYWLRASLPMLLLKRI